MTTRFSLVTFGELSIETDGERPAPLASQRKALALLALLAAGGRRGVLREKIVGYLWPDGDEEAGRNSLAQLLHRVRRELGPDAIVGNGALSLNVEILSSDVGAFRSMIAEGNLTAAAALYRAPFLDGVQLRIGAEFERWIDVERNALAAMYATALDRLAAEAEKRQDYAACVAWSRRRADIDPFNAATSLKYMDALVASGNREAAIRHAQVYAALVRAELDAEPDRTVMDRADSLRTGVVAAAPLARLVADAETGIPPHAASAPADIPAADFVRHNGRARPLLGRRYVAAAAVGIVLVGSAVLATGSKLRATGASAPSVSALAMRSSDVRITSVATSAFVADNGDVTRDGRHFIGGTGENWRQLTRLELSTGTVDTIAAFEGNIDNVRVNADGRLIAVSVWVDILPTERATFGGTSIWVVASDGSDKRLIARPHHVADFEPVGWTADDRQILVNVQRDSGSGASYRDDSYLGKLSATDGRLEVVGHLGPGWPFGVRVSPDGRHVAYTTRDRTNGHTTARVLDMATGTSSDVFMSTGNDQFLSWTTDGRGVHISRANAAGRSLWMQPVSDGRASGTAIMVKADFPAIQPVGTSADGRFHYVVSSGGPEVIVVSIDPRTGVAGPPTPVVVRASYGTAGGVFSPDGKYVAYIARHDNWSIPGTGSLVLQTIDGREIREIPLATRNSLIVNWTPDARRVLVRGEGPEGEEGLLIDVAIGKSVARSSYVEPAWIALGRPAILADGSVLRGLRDTTAADRWQEAENKVVLLDAATGEDRVLGRVSRMVRLVPAGDGKAFVALIQERGTKSLELYAIRNGRIAFVRRLAPLSAPHQGRDGTSTIWSTDGKYILVAIDMSAPDGPPLTTVMRYPVSGGAPEHLFDIHDHAILNSVHPDGRRFAFLKTARPSSELFALEHK